MCKVFINGQENFNWFFSSCFTEEPPQLHVICCISKCILWLWKENAFQSSIQPGDRQQLNCKKHLILNNFPMTFLKCRIILLWIQPAPYKTLELWAEQLLCTWHLGVLLLHPWQWPSWQLLPLHIVSLHDCTSQNIGMQLMMRHLTRKGSMEPVSSELAGHNSCWSNASLDFLGVHELFVENTLLCGSPHIVLYSRKAITFVVDRSQIKSRFHPLEAVSLQARCSVTFPPVYNGGTALYLVHNEGGQSTPPQNMPLGHWIILQWRQVRNSRHCPPLSARSRA